jgi:hypothetical protein
MAHRYNWLCLAFGVVGLYLTSIDQVRNDLLSRISRLRVPAELGAAEASCRKMDEVSCTRLARSCIF